MGRKKQTTVEETRTLREQFQDYIKDLVMEFEAATGMKVNWIDVKHTRKPGFESKDETIIEAHLDL